MWRKFGTFAVAFLFIFSLASVVDAQMRRGNAQRRGPDGLKDIPGQNKPAENPGNGNQGESPGNGNEGENPGHGTPDGLTPSQEDVCDDLKYGTPGLYGLCIAFCEAHDSECVPDLALEDPFANCRRRDAKILRNYKKKMREGDPDMPCLPSAGEDPQYACPCWSQEDLEYFPFSLLSYQVDETFGGCETNSYQEYWDHDEETGESTFECAETTSYITETSNLSDGSSFRFQLKAVAGDCNDTYCFSYVGCWDGNCPDELPPSSEGFEMSIGPEDYENCAMAIEQLALTYCD
jgi:hypothetical protein